MGPWEKRRLLYKHIGEFLREMAVLVIVFGNLESLVQKELRNQPGAGC